MTISANIQFTDTATQICIITIKDGNDIVCDSVNIGLNLNPDETIDTEDLNCRIKKQVKAYRYNNTKFMIDTGGE
jgi:glycosylphosphatidylinositol transamidase (GPIT) subunit GPI8